MGDRLLSQPWVLAQGCSGLPGPPVCWMRKLHTGHYSIHPAPPRGVSPWEDLQGLEGGMDPF